MELAENNLIKTLVLNIRNGDENAFDELFRIHYKLLKNYALRFLEQTEQAEDIVQDVFIFAWENRQNLDENLSIRSYLLTMVKNRCLNCLKHEKVELNFKSKRKHELDEFYFDLLTDRKDSLLEKELISEITKGIDQLPEQCKRVFRLSRVFGLKNKEIAAELNISDKAVEKHISKALQSLRIYLKDFLFSIFY